MSLFPTLQGRACGYVNLSELAKSVRAGAPFAANPCIDPVKFTQIILEHHKQRGIEYSYGGYLEDRSVLWEGIDYMRERDTFLHVGVDFNVPAGTPVAASRAGVVERIDNDYPEEYGWGGRVTLKLKDLPLYAVYAHLDPDQIACQVGQTLTHKNYIGKVGSPPHNGGWFPHLHVQLVTAEAWNFYKSRLSEMDGYGRIDNLATLSKKFPDPLPYLRVW